MLSRTLAALVLPITFLGCGGTSAPTAPPPPSGVLDLVVGSYNLTLTMSQSGDPVCDGNFCTSGSACGGTAGVPAVTTFRTAAHLDRSGDEISIRPDDPSATLRLNLRLTGTALEGTVSGHFQDGLVAIAVFSGDGRPTAVTRGTMLPASAAGRIEGQVSAGGYSCSNNGHSWTLVAR